MHLSNATARSRAAAQPPAMVAAAANRTVPVGRADRPTHRLADREFSEYLRVIRGVELGPNLRTLTARARQEVLVLRADRQAGPVWETMDMLAAARGVTVRVLRPRTDPDTDPVAGENGVVGEAAGAVTIVPDRAGSATGMNRGSDTSSAPGAAVIPRRPDAADPAGGHRNVRTAVGGGPTAPPQSPADLPAAQFVRVDGPTHSLLGPGVQIRELAKSSTAFLVVDRELAALAIEPVDTAGPQLVTRAPGIVAALVAAFERHWSTALPTTPGGGLPEGAAMDILSCMADGMTDESIARHLGVCTRTVGRAVGRMMDSLGARNRFELGIRALRAGWFD